jgi:glycosyltransferase involved in cell wall biosynthesis
MKAAKYTPRVWINVSTSVTWTRPAVGIVRVERALVEQLQLLLGEERCKLCVWHDDRFVEWVPSSVTMSPHVEQAVDTILPRGPAFDIARPFLVRALQKFSRRDRDTANPSGELRVALPTSEEPALHPAPGDFLVSVGLDWDGTYTKNFFDIAKSQGLRIITCCYDLIPVLFPQYCVGEVAQKFTEYFLELSWGSEAVMCISEQTQRDYMRLCEELGAPNRTTVVIPLGDSIASAESVVGEPVLAATRKPFILFVSTIERRKNHEVLYRAYHLLARRGLSALLPKLVFVGMQGWGVGDLMKDIELDPLTSGLIVQLNHVTDSELAHLYKQALFCVYPSLYEGWGLPVAEALALGKAVISSREGSLPEVGGELVRYLSAWDPYEWANAIQEYLENPSLLEEMEYRVQANYRPRQWSDTAKAVSGLIDALIDGDNGDATELLPGYAMSTHCGIHVGPSILATGTSGLLLFGPHRAMRKGHYLLQLFGSALGGDQGVLLLEIASDAGTELHHTLALDSPHPRAVWPIELRFTLDRNVDDLEIKCTVAQSVRIQIDRISISPAVPAVAKSPLTRGSEAMMK